MTGSRNQPAQQGGNISVAEIDGWRSGRGGGCGHAVSLAVGWAKETSYRATANESARVWNSDDEYPDSKDLFLKFEPDVDFLADFLADPPPNERKGRITFGSEITIADEARR